MATMTKLYHYGYNQCGYMPDNDSECDPVCFDDAKRGLIETIKSVFEDQAESEDEAEEYCAFAEDVNLSGEEEITAICNGWAFWIIESDKTISPELESEFNNMDSYPIMEFKQNDGDYLVINIQASEYGLSFDLIASDEECYFDGDVIRLDNGYWFIPFDYYFDNLQYYLEKISDNIIEGYLIPNGLYSSDEE